MKTQKSEVCLGKPVSHALRGLKSAADKAGLEDIGLDTLRHSATPVMLSNGLPITVVSQILRHAGVSVTVDVYGTSRPTSPAGHWTSLPQPCRHPKLHANHSHAKWMRTRRGKGRFPRSARIIENGL